jgi:hypothetical protein
VAGHLRDGIVNARSEARTPVAKGHGAGVMVVCSLMMLVASMRTPI